MASGRVIAPQLRTKAEENGGVDDSNKQDRHQGRD